MKCGVIYKIENNNGGIYIGKSVNFSTRLSAYRNLRCEKQKAIYNSLKKYGFESHTFTIIYKGLSDLLNEKEKEYIKIYNSFNKDNPSGLNLTRGGCGILGYKQSQETIMKKNKVHIGAKRSDECKKLMSISAKKRAPNFINKKHSIETLEKMAQKKRGKIQSKVTIDLKKESTINNRLKNLGTILQISLKGEVIKEWLPSFVLISSELGCDPSTIRRAVNSDGEKVRLGYKWKYNKR